jgi:hypothetical protein
MQRLADDGHDLRSAWQLLALFEDIQSEMAQHHRLLVRDTDERDARRRAEIGNAKS